MAELEETEALSQARQSEAEEERLVPGMLVTERVRLLCPLDRGGMGAVWVAEHLTLGTEVAVKFVLGRAGENQAKRLAREAQIAARLVDPHAVRVLDHGRTPEGTPFIVMELLEGESLSDRIKRDGPLPPEQVRKLVEQVAGVLQEAHRLGIAHRDIKPHNIVLLDATDELFAKVLDFGIAKAIEEDATSSLTAEGEVIGTPVYMAPEQLVEGIPADDGADLWGLTVVAYQALTGRRPFEGRTRAALGVAILLGRYAPPSRLVPSLPAAVDRWFARNLSVERRDRAATAGELAETFEEAASGTAAVAAEPAPHEGRLHIPDRLYGREAEIATLLRAFERAAADRTRLVLVAGYSGIGKTALVAEIEKPLGKRGATFVGGKFDQFDRGTPYASLVQAFRGLVLRILAGDEREKWRGRIVGGVRDNLAALTDVIPELEELIGPQPALAPASPGEARSRFQATIGRFVAAIATPEQPLAIFLDDLQWADLPSLDLIASLAANPESRHVLLIGTYRDNDVDEGHPLTAMVARVKDSETAVDELTLGPLGEEAVLDLVSDATDNAPGRVRLAVECHKKTRGNAFFLRRFLESLTEADLLRYDPNAGNWTWDLTEIQAVPMAPSVVDFVADEMRRLPEAEREALGVAACIGARFDLAALAFVLGAERGRALEALRSALETELVVPETHGSWVSAPIDVHAGRLSFRFAHDRVRQAAHSLVDEKAASAIHERVGHYLLDHLDPSEREQRLFEVVEHLNRGVEEDLETTGASRLRDLNLSAGRRALASAAFEPAFRYYEEARRRLSKRAWEDAYEETLAIHVEGARAAYLSGNYESMEELVERAVMHATSLVDRVGAEEVRVLARVSQERFAEAFDLALPVLAELGISVPESPTEEDVQGAVGASLAAIEERGVETLLGLERCDDPRVVASMRILQEVMSTAYLVQPQLVPIFVSHMVRTTVEHGLCRESPYGFSVLALVSNAANMIGTAKGVGDLALGLLDRLDDRTTRPSTLHVIVCYVSAWTNPLRDSVEAERRVFQFGMDVGDLEYAGWGLHVGMLNAFVSGVELSGLLETGQNDIAILRYHQQLPPLSCSVPVAGAAATLAGEETDPPYDEAAHLAALEKAGFRGGVCVTATMGCFVRFVLGDFEGAIEWADKSLAHGDGAVATYNAVVARQTRALASLAKTEADAVDREAAIASVAPHLEQLRVWNAASEANHAHRIQLIEAEIARLEGRDDDATTLYEKAIAHAKRERFTQDEAIASELAARFHLAADRADRARAHLDAARAAYERWGAHAKCAQLDETYAALLD
jgi:predicted ATPase